MRVFLAGLILLTFWPVAFAQNSNFSVDRLVVYKRERKLVLLSQGKEVRSYKVALGGEPVGPKSRRGDHRTPQGVYVLDSRNPNSHFYKAFHISYPNAQDIAAAKKLGVSPGGDIMLH
jgi:murein L,D-transpeptidase YafK